MWTFLVVHALASGIGSRADGQIVTGLWATLGGGSGWAHLSCRVDDCYNPDELLASGGAAATLVQVGLTLGRRVRVGGEFDYWGNSYNEFVRSRLTHTSLVISYDLLLHPRIFARGGIGLGRMRFGAPALGTFAGKGVASLLGIGLDTPISRNISVGPMVTYYHSSLKGEPELGHEYGWNASMWLIGAAITMHQ